MKITIYTITDCAFSKQEKEYLTGHGFQFEEKNLETNREFLTEMLAIGSNFAGTPVTKIEKDDEQIVVLKGFTAAEFDKALALAPAAVEPTSAKAMAGEPVKPVEPVATPVSEVAPVVVEPVAAAPVAEVVPPAPTVDPAMANVLNALEQQAAPIDVAQPPVEAVAAAPVAPATDPNTPVIPDPQF